MLCYRIYLFICKKTTASKSQRNRKHIRNENSVILVVCGREIFYESKKNIYIKQIGERKQ